MARPRKPIEAPPRRNFLRDGGDVPADNPAECERLAAMLPRIADPEAFRRDVLGASTWLNLGLFEKTFSDPKAVYGELGELCRRLESVLVALTDLGDDAAKALHQAAEKRHPHREGSPSGDRGESPWQWLEPRNMSPSGAIRIKWVKLVLTDCWFWAMVAHANIPIPRVIIDQPDPDDPEAPLRPRRRGGGRPRDAQAEEAMRRLIFIWHEQTGKPPTISTDPSTGRKKTEKPFLTFCKAIIGPIYEARGMKSPSIAPLAQKMLYPPK